MQHDGRRPRLPSLPPPGKRGGKKVPKKSATSETEQHAKEVRAVIRGKDIVDRPEKKSDGSPAQFTGDMMFVRSWMKNRPLEPQVQAAALVHFPRQWATRRGRYCRFQAPGAGSYGLLRARPTF
jgi:hypothetical protein